MNLRTPQPIQEQYAVLESQARISVFSSYVRFDSILKLRETRQLPGKTEAALAH